MGAVRVAVNGDADQVRQFLDHDDKGGGGGFATVEEAAAGFAMGDAT